jgi:hypothetical protein
MNDEWPWITTRVAGIALAAPLVIIIIDMIYLIWRG